MRVELEIVPKKKRGTCVQTSTPIRRISTAGSPNRHDVAQEWTFMLALQSLKLKPPGPTVPQNSQKPADDPVPSLRA